MSAQRLTPKQRLVLAVVAAALLCATSLHFRYWSFVHAPGGGSSSSGSSGSALRPRAERSTLVAGIIVGGGARDNDEGQSGGSSGGTLVEVTGDEVTLRADGDGDAIAALVQDTMAGSGSGGGFRAVPLNRDVFAIIQNEPLVETASEFKQLHHGIYRATGASSGVQFALKTECRPPAKWHGQQGWPEVAVFNLMRIVFADAPHLNSVPPARGVVVRVTDEAVARVVHRDRCGVWAGPSPVDGRPPPRGHVFLIGVALEWQSRHDENALPPRSAVAMFANPPHGAAGSGVEQDTAAGALISPTRRRVQKPDAEQRELLNQISDVQTLDFVVGNEDREDKNWFWNHPEEDATRKLVQMDNGWAFSGSLYQESVCGAHEALLACPPLLRYLTRSPMCRSRDATPVSNCRFRRSTVSRLKTVAALWEQRKAGRAHTSAAAWREVLSRDVLIAWLLETYDYGAASSRAASASATAASAAAGVAKTSALPAKPRVGPFSMALARYVKGCPAALGIERRWRAAAGQDSGSGDGGDNAARVNNTLRATADHPLLLALSHGISVRLKRLLTHVSDRCLARFGDAYVFA